MNKKIIPFVEYAAESMTACLVTMLQGNMLALTVTHLVIASQTGIIAGAITAIGLYFARTSRRWMQCVRFAWISCALLCTVMQSRQRAPR